IYEKMYNGSRSEPALARGVAQADESRRRGVIMEAIAGVDIAVWDVKAQALGVPLYQALGAVRSSVRGYASGGWAPGGAAAVGRLVTRPRRSSQVTRPKASALPRCAWSATTVSRLPNACGGSRRRGAGLALASN